MKIRMKNPNTPIHPCKIFCTTNAEQGQTNTNEFVDFDGLTKREYFAAMAMQAIVSQYGLCRNTIDNDNFPHNERNAVIVSKHAIMLADEMLKQIGEPHY